LLDAIVKPVSQAVKTGDTKVKKTKKKTGAANGEKKAKLGKKKNRSLIKPEKDMTKGPRRSRKGVLAFKADQQKAFQRKEIPDERMPGCKGGKEGSRFQGRSTRFLSR